MLRFVRPVVHCCCVATFPRFRFPAVLFITFHDYKLSLYIEHLLSHWYYSVVLNHIYSPFCQRGTLFSVLNIHNFYVPVQCIQLQEIFVSIINTFWTVHFVSKQRENTIIHVISLLIIFHTHNIVRNSGTFSIAYFKRPVPSFW